MRRHIIIAIAVIFVVMAGIMVFSGKEAQAISRMKLRDGTLVKTAYSPTVYMIVNDGKKVALGMSWKSLSEGVLGGTPKVMTISKTELSRYPGIGVAESMYALLQHDENYSGRYYRGFFVKDKYSSTIFYSIGTKYSSRWRPVPSMEVLNSYNPQNIFLSCNFQGGSGSAMKIRESSLIKGSGPTVYVVVNNGKKVGKAALNMSMNTLKKIVHGGNPKIITVSDVELSRYASFGTINEKDAWKLQHSKGIFLSSTAGPEIFYVYDATALDDPDIKIKIFPNMTVLNSYSPQNIFTLL